MWEAPFLSLREACAVTVLACVTGGVLLGVAGHFSAADERIRTAPLCTAEQAFTPARCRFAFDGTVTDATGSRAGLDVWGRHYTVDAVIRGKPETHVGKAVRVTMYRGEPVRVEGASLVFDVDGTPASRADFWRNTGYVLLLAGVFGGGGSVVVALLTRPRKTRSEGAGQPGTQAGARAR
ncbi:hypothetical protein GCM10009827_046490 [Dactylosporangium maewongense]|uniref:DUF3592 domain-containing protein n=1 Tax=Dactylosporangium maewongense TaxID=634393 RepID=A0ABP4LKX5_9ACTN